MDLSPQILTSGRGGGGNSETIDDLTFRLVLSNNRLLHFVVALYCRIIVALCCRIELWVICFVLRAA